MSREFLTVPELADLLRIKERKVYDLAATGLVPCTRATGKLLFPESEIRAWIASQQTGSKSPRPAVFLGSHDPILDWALRQSQSGLATFFDGSSDGLRRFAGREGVAAGLHIPDAKGWNISAVKETCAKSNAVLIHWAERVRGFVVRQDRDFPSSDLTALSGLRIAIRQPGSGTATLFDNLMLDAGVEYEPVGPYHNEQDAVLSVLNGEADVAFGLEGMAHQFDLGFHPSVDESFDLLIDRRAYFEPPIQTLLSFCRSDEFLSRASGQSGYSFTQLGQVLWNS